jgi:hypothetical protein
MASAQVRNFKSADESRDIPGGKVQVINSPAGTAALGTLNPGWKWSTNVKPVVGTEWCEVEHFDYVVSGRLAGKLKDGTEFEAGPGDVIYIPPGHDGWVVGDEPFVSIGFGPASAEFGKPR